MKHYLTQEHIEILDSILGYIPKYDTFKLTEISKKISDFDNNYSDWTYLFSKITATHGDIFNSLWLNGFIKIIDAENGICKLTSDGHKLKDIGNYDGYLKQLNAEYKAKGAENFLKTYWYIPSIITFILGLLTAYLVNVVTVNKECNNPSHNQNIIKAKQTTVDTSK